MGNAGEARLDVVALGRDEVTATLNKVNGELDAMKGKLAAYERATKGTAEASRLASTESRSFGAAVEGISKNVKDGIKPVNAAREGIENLRANFLVFPAAIAGGIAALTEWVDGLFAANSATKWWQENSQRVVAAADALASVVKRLRELNSPDTNPLAGLIGPEVEQMLATSREGVTQLKRKLEELKAMGGVIAALGLEDVDKNVVRDILGAMVGKVQEAGQSAKEIEDTQKRINQLIREEVQYREEVAVALRNQEVAQRDLAQAEFNRLAGQAVDKGTGGATTSAELFASFLTAAAVKPPPRPGGARRETAAQRAARESRELMAFLMAEDFENRERARKESEERSSESARSGADAASASASDMALLMREDFEAREAMARRERERVDELAESYRALGEVIGGALPENYGHFVTSMAEAISAMSKIEDADKRGIIGAAGLAKAAFDLGAAEAKTARQRYAWKAAGEVAEAAAAAARLDFWAAGAHIGAAGLFGIAAATAGGGASTGGGRSYGARGNASSSAGSGEGGGTTVINFNQLVADKQTVTRGVQEAAYAGRNNGYARRRGT